MYAFIYANTYKWEGGGFVVIGLSCHSSSFKREALHASFHFMLADILVFVFWNICWRKFGSRTRFGLLLKTYIFHCTRFNNFYKEFYSSLTYYGYALGDHPSTWDGKLGLDCHLPWSLLPKRSCISLCFIVSGSAVISYHPSISNG